MSTMLSDYKNMNCEGADAARGFDLLVRYSPEEKKHVFKLALSLTGGPAAALLRMASPVKFGLPEMREEKMIKSILQYKQSWNNVSYFDKRDIIAALRSEVRDMKEATGFVISVAKLVALLA